MTYAFTFDASACTGCKACQIACKDKNNLPVGVLWRRVYEVSGGSWTNVGAGSSCPGVGEPTPYPVWETDVFAYNLSIACNHCVHPKCAGVCPTDAYVQREDGIVYIDTTKCMGCGYCSWACPYSAPRYNPELRHMTKCNFCVDNLDAGLPPACVAACPMRVLDFVTVDDGKWTMENGQRSMVYHPLWNSPATEHPFPLPERSRTEPHLAVQPHTGMGNNLEKAISNWEEIKTGYIKSERPLVAFTLLEQMAAGMAILSFFSGPLSLPFLSTLGGLIGVGGLISVLHLGTPINAWRAVFHLKKSWLSREILMFGLFGASWLLALILPGMGKLPLVLSGIGLVYSMAQVYRLRSIQAWDSWRTNLGFFVTALLLGSLAMLSASGLENLLSARIWYVTSTSHTSAWSLTLLFVAQLTVEISGKGIIRKTVGRLRLGLIAGGVLISLILLFVSDALSIWLIPFLFVLAFVEEALGRWLFYEHLKHRNL